MLQLTRPSVAALLRGLAAERQPLCGPMRLATPRHSDTRLGVARGTVVPSQLNVGAPSCQPYRLTVRAGLLSWSSDQGCRPVRACPQGLASVPRTDSAQVHGVGW